MFNWFFNPPEIKLPKIDRSMEYSQEIKSNFSWDKVVVTATTNGSLKIDFGEDYTFIVPGVNRHDLLDMIEKAVDMADLIDPKNE